MAAALHPVLSSILACPRCRGDLLIVGADGATACRCARCAAEFPVQEGIPRLTDGAAERDPRLAAEWTAQSSAFPLYLDRGSILNRWEEQVLPRLIGWLGDVRGPVLDAGCGVGHLGRVLEGIGRRDLTVIGLDFQGQLLAEATSGYAARVEGDMHHLPFRTGSIAAAVASNSLHHVPDPVTALRELARVLVPGGTVVTHDPRFLAPLEMAKKFVRKGDHMFTEDHKAFRPDEYRALFEDAGLTVHDVHLVDPLGPLLATGLDYLKIGRLFGLAGPVARGLAATDRLLGGRGSHTPLGLMVAVQAVKNSR